MIRLLCVEDDALVRTYLAARLELEPDLRMVGSVSSAGEALIFLRSEPVDVLLLDYRLAGADGLQLLRALSQAPELAGPQPRVLFCTAADNETFNSEARQSGAAGVVGKERMAAELLPALRAVA